MGWGCDKKWLIINMEILLGIVCIYKFCYGFEIRMSFVLDSVLVKRKLNVVIDISGID